MADQASSRRSSSTSLTLLDGIKTQDREAWEKLVAIYGPLVYEWCRCQGIQPSEAADVVQEVFCTVWRSVGGFRSDRTGGTFRGWLWAITRSRVFDYFRARGGQPEAFGGTDAFGYWQQLPVWEPAVVSEPTLKTAAYSPLRRALEHIRVDFRERTWEAFWRATVERQPTQEIAADLGMSANAVRTAKSKVLRRLRGEFGDLFD